MNNLDKAGNYLGTGIGIVFVLLGRLIVDWKPGVSAATQVSENESVYDRQAYRGIPVSHPG